MTDSSIASQFGHVYLLELVERLLKAQSLERAMAIVGSYLKFGVPIYGLTLILKTADNKYQIQTPLLSQSSEPESFEMDFTTLSQLLSADQRSQAQVILEATKSSAVAQLLSHSEGWELFPIGLTSDSLGFALMNVPENLSDSDLQFIRGVCEHIALTILRFQQIHHLEEISQHVSEANTALLEREEHLQRSNKELIATLNELNQAQEELLEVKKHASLGKLVRGVAHEINTPTGVCVTASTALQDLCYQIAESVKQKSLTQTQFETKFNTVKDMADLVQRNCTRISNLVSTFKLASTDEWTEQPIKFSLGEVLKDSIHRTYQQFDKRPLVHLEGDLDESMVGFPTVLNEAIVNLLNNAFQYACTHEDDQVWLKVSDQGTDLRITIRDQGPGMSSEQIEKLFEPFSTSSHNNNNLGLGAHITYNLVTQKYTGQIKIISQTYEPTEIEILIPKNVKQTTAPLGHTV